MRLYEGCGVRGAEKEEVGVRRCVLGLMRVYRKQSAGPLAVFKVYSTTPLWFVLLADMGWWFEVWN
jgi:hypothetical protein